MKQTHNRTLLSFTGILAIALFSTLFSSNNAECRVGGGRSFGSRGSRGFVSPMRSGSQFRTNNSNTFNTNGGYHSQPATPYGTRPNPSPFGAVPSVWKSVGAGLAGGMIGSMLMRSLGGSGYMAPGMGGGGGFGFLEILLLAGLGFWLFRIFANRTQTSSANASRQNYYRENGSEDNSAQDSSGAAELMRRARPNGWSSAAGSTPSSIPYNSSGNSTYNSPYNSSGGDFGPSLSTEKAMDLFFQIQGAWGNRELSSVLSILDRDAKDYLEQEVSRLKASHQINRLENIAVRSTEVVESWKDPEKDYATVKFVANLLDFTIDENTQQVVEGSKSTPVKFEEYWTFSKNQDSSDWKLSAIQQN